MTKITVPEAARRWVTEHSRQSKVHDQGFTLSLDWWHNRLEGLPGGPVTAEDGLFSGKGRIGRAYLFSLANDAVSDDTGSSALKLLWHTLLWGTGDGNRNNLQRIKAIAEDPHMAAILLRDAARISRRHPREAFDTLRPKGNAIRSLGPAFFTKFLYFAGGGQPDHPCLIIDNRVLSTIWRETGGCNDDLKPRHNYGARTYVAALEILTNWAEQLTTNERIVAPDELERWAFEPIADDEE